MGCLMWGFWRKLTALWRPRTVFRFFYHITGQLFSCLEALAAVSLLVSAVLTNLANRGTYGFPPPGFITKVRFVARDVDQGWGVTKLTKIPFRHTLLFFSIARTHLSYWISHLYLTGVTTAQLRRQLSNMNVIQIIWEVLLLDRKFCLRRN